MNYLYDPEDWAESLSDETDVIYISGDRTDFNINFQEDELVFNVEMSGNFDSEMFAVNGKEALEDVQFRLIARVPQPEETLSQEALDLIDDKDDSCPDE